MDEAALGEEVDVVDVDVSGFWGCTDDAVCNEGQWSYEDSHDIAAGALCAATLRFAAWENCCVCRNEGNMCLPAIQLPSFPATKGACVYVAEASERGQNWHHDITYVRCQDV